MNDEESRKIVSAVHKLEAFGWELITVPLSHTMMYMTESGEVDITPPDPDKIDYDFVYRGSLKNQDDIELLWESNLKSLGFDEHHRMLLGEDIVHFYHWFDFEL